MVLVRNQLETNYHKIVTLLDGLQSVIRPICVADKKFLLEFHSRLSAETRFFRYHYSKGDLTSIELDDFCTIDYQDNYALVAERKINGQKGIVGVGRFYRLPTNVHTAEVAFVVQDSEQRKGLGTQLLKHLAKLAWDQDIYFFTGEVLRENGRMLSIFIKSDPEMHFTDEDDHTCIVKLSIREILDRMF